MVQVMHAHALQPESSEPLTNVIIGNFKIMPANPAYATFAASFCASACHVDYRTHGDKVVCHIKLAT